ncbi:MAG: RHS repeat-associated core domain-containing protein [Massilia sp.]
MTSTTGPYPARSNLYDGAGNLTSDGTVSYSYSARGRLSQISNAGVTVSYLYNGLGQRVSKQGATVPTGANHFFYDEQGKLIGEYDATGAAIEETVYLGDMPVAILKLPVAPDTQLAVFYVYSDHINTPRAITRSSDNTMVWRWDLSDPFGVGQPDESPAGAGTFAYNPRFPGQLFDRETNNHYNYYRDYDPQTGRYVQSDPIGLEGGLNTYSYVSGSPLSFYDPLD